MPIYSVRGNIFEAGPQIAEVIAPWLRNGFNMRWVSWKEFVKDHGNALAGAQTIGGAPFGAFWQEPWQAGMDTLWKLAVPIGNCEFLYFFSNPGDPLGCPTVGDVADMVRRGLDSAAAVGAKSVAFIHIPSIQNHNPPNSADDRQTASAMYDAAAGWLANLPEDDFNIYLVDREGDFGTLPGIIQYQPGAA